MAYKYFHDAIAKTVYRVDDDPNILENKDGLGRGRPWYISTKVDITRADNVLIKNQWRYETSKIHAEHFDRKYSRDEVISYFMSRIYPHNCTEITSEEYDALKTKYDTEARSRHIA